jgi:hypothetical protein
LEANAIAADIGHGRGGVHYTMGQLFGRQPNLVV